MSNASLNPVASSGSHPGWPRILLLLAVVLFVLLLLFSETAWAMVQIWERSETFAHAFLVPPITLWLIWRRRADLAQMTPRPAPWLLVPLALFALVWMLGEMAATNAVTQLMLVAMLITTAATIVGLQVARALAFPLLFLFFCVPIGEFMQPWLMEHTANFTIAALRLCGVPVYREGLDFVIPTGRWSVVEACSGVRYLIASLMVGTLFAYLSYHSLKRRLAFVAVAIVLPIVANWVRAWGIVMLGHFSGNKLAVGVDHIIYGWVFFGLIMLAMFMIGARWSQPELPHPLPQIEQVADGAGRSRALFTAALCCLVLAAPQLVLKRLAAQQEPGAGAPELTPPSLAAQGWQGAAAPLTPWRPVFVNPVAERLEVFARAGQRVAMDTAYFRHQSFDSKLVSSTHETVPRAKAGWSSIGETQLQFDFKGSPVRVPVTVLVGDAGRRLLVARIYWLQGAWSSSDYTAKLRDLLNRLAGRGDAAASLVFMAEPADGKADPATLRDFLQTNAVALDAWLASTKTRGVATAPSPDN
ncbi:MAG TPA: exosortase A [Burkholderiaceae bacterium]